MKSRTSIALAVGLLVAWPAGLPVVGANHAPALIGVAPLFTNITTTAGLGSPGTALPPPQIIVEDNAAFLNGGKGAAWFDYDRDGWEDVLISGYHKRELYHNNGDGTFTDVTQESGIAGDLYTMGVITPDFNNDGYPDIVLANWYAKCEIFINNGNGTFRNVTQAWNFVFSGPSSGMAFGDLDGDGWGDLFIGSYYRRSKALFRNLQGNGLEDVTKKAGVADLTGYTFQPLIFDYDHDGKLDIYDVNDFGADALFHNEGNMTFTDVSVASGVAIKGDGMGGEIGDINGDGYMDVFVTNFADDNWMVYDPVNKTFSDQHLGMNITDQDVGWGVNIDDFNNDGYLDVFVADGRVLAAQQPEPDRLWINQGDNTFVDMSDQAGVRDFGINRGSSTVDFNKDGQMDLWVSNVVTNSSFYRNQGNSNHWLEAKLEGVVSIRDAVGARLTLEAGGRTQTRVVHMGASYLSMPSLVQHFGLGNASVVDRLTVDWPSGVHQVFENVTPDQRLAIRENETNPPTARAPDIVQQAGSEVQFDGSGSTDDTKLVSYAWNFSAPWASLNMSGVRASYTFYDPMNFTGTLRVTDAFGNSNTTTFNITILPVGHPLVSAGPDIQALQNSTLNFSGTIKGGGPWDDYLNVTFNWSISGPDGVVNLSGRNVSHTFTVPGVYNVSLAGTDQFGGVGTDWLLVTIGDTEPPVIRFTPPDAVPEDTTFILDASATTDNDPSFATTGLFYWRVTGALGEFYVRTGSVASFMLRDPGPAVISLEVNDSAGNVASTVFTIMAIDGTRPLAEGGSDRILIAGAAVTLNASASSDNDPNFLRDGTFEWTFDGPDGVGRAFGLTTTVTFTNPGVTRVRLHVVDPSGNEDVQDDQFNITALDRTAPTVAVLGDLNITFGRPVRFESGAVTDNDPSFNTTGLYTWTVIDGTALRTLNGSSVNYTFANAGAWHVTLRVQDAAGNAVVRAFNVTVTDRTPPVIVASIANASLVGEPVAFNSTDSSDDVGILSIAWTIAGPAGESTVNGRYVRWTFDAPGNYTVTLRVADAAGNVATQSFNITVSAVDIPCSPCGPANNTTDGNGSQPRGDSGVVLAVGALAAAAAVAAAFMVLRRRRQGQA